MIIDCRRSMSAMMATITTIAMLSFVDALAHYL